MKVPDKHCRKCDRDLPVESFTHFINHKGEVRAKPYCMVCTSAIARNWYYENRERAKARMLVYSRDRRNCCGPATKSRSGRPKRQMIDGLLRCSRCKQMLPPEKFYHYVSGPAGHSSDCKPCRIAYASARYRMYPHIRARMAESNARYRARIKAAKNPINP